MESILCAICINSIQNRQLVSVEECGHVFHRICLNTWLNGDGRASRQCPQCRTTISKYHQIFINFEENSVAKELKDEVNNQLESLRSEVTKLNSYIKKLESKCESTTKALDSMKKKAETLRKLNRDQEKRVNHLEKELSSANKEAEQYRVQKEILDVNVTDVEPQTDLVSSNLIIKLLRNELIQSRKKNCRLARNAMPVKKPEPLKDLNLSVNQVADTVPRYSTRLFKKNLSKNPFNIDCADKKYGKRKTDNDASCIIISDDDDDANSIATTVKTKRARKNIYEFVDKFSKK